MNAPSERSAVRVVSHDDGSYTVTPEGGRPEKHPDCASAVQAIKRHHRRVEAGTRGIAPVVARMAARPLAEPTGRCINLAAERVRKSAALPEPKSEPAPWWIEYGAPAFGLLILAAVLTLIVG